MKAAPGRLTVARLTVINCLGVEESTIDLTDGVNVFKGRNESGKTTRLKALRRTLGLERATLGSLTPAGEGEHEPAVEVLLVGDDMEVKVRRQGDGSPDVRYRQGDDWIKSKRPVEWLNGLINARAALPALWLAADDEQRATMILEACKIEGYSREQALEVIGLTGFRLPPIPTNLHPLEDLEKIEEAIKASRVVVGRNQKDEASAAAKLLEGLPAEPLTDVQEQIEYLTRTSTEMAEEVAAKAATIRGEFSARQASATRALDAETEALKADHASVEAAIRADAERKIAAHLAITNEQIDVARAQYQNEIATARAEMEADQRAIEANGEALATARERLASLRATQEAVKTDRFVRERAAEAMEKAHQHQLKYADLTMALDRLAVYRLRLTEQLPIKGLTVHFDDLGRKTLMHDGKPSAHWSDGEAAKLAMEYAMLGGTPPEDGRPYIPLIILDRAGELSTARRVALLREVQARGNQVLAAVTAECEFTVLTGEEALVDA